MTTSISSFIFALALAASGLCPSSSFAASEDVRPGIATFTITRDGVDQPLQAAIWYPVRRPGVDGKPAEIGNAVFEPIALQQDAEIAKGRHPVVLISHGLGGNYRSLTWLAAALAEHGAIAISVSHPNSSTGDIHMTKAFDHWTRGRDLEAALASVEADPRFAEGVDPARIYVAGFSFGGWTALSMAGVRGNIEGFADYCSTKGKASTHCHDIAKWGVDLRARDAAAWDASYKDPRIKAAAAIDPAFTFGIGADGIREVSAKVLMIGLGDGPDRLAATDFSEAGSNFGAVFGAAQKLAIAPANHFTALMLCRPEGANILAAENDDPVCTDPPGTDRKAVHDAIIASIVEEFGLN